MIIGLSILLSAAAAGAFYRWQRSLPKQFDSLITKAEEARARGLLTSAEEACLAAVRCAGRIRINRGDLLVVASYNLAAVYLQAGNLERAEQIALKAFAELRNFGKPSRFAIPLIGLMAQIYKRAGKDLSAAGVFEVWVQLLRKVCGSRSIKVAEALHELGVTLSRAGVQERAIAVLEECIPLFEEHRGKDHRDVAAALTNLGLAQSRAKRFGDAERTQRRVVAMREAALGLDDPEVAQALNNLSVTYKRQERIPEALDCLRRSLAIREAKLGPDHPNVGLVLNNLGNCLRLEKKFAEAESALTRAKTILQNPPHKSFATVLDSLGGLRADQRRYEEAEQFYLECVKLHESRPGSNLSDFADTCERFAGVLYKLQKEKQADAMMEHVNKIRGQLEKLVTPAI